ncbi:MAG: HIT family protein [Candidatus Woesearchaeota archaeon]|jgi:histidine triad (HIT) family protein|nr:HIT family protein [Candidatus Woesearchaeota archaeon]
MNKDECIFCKIVSGEIPSYKVYEDEDIMAFFDISIGNDFHTLVIPKKHSEDIFDIEEILLQKLISVTKKIATKYKEELNIDNVNIIQSNGKDAQQDVFHYHMHILPRNKNDKTIIKFNQDLNNHERLCANHKKIKGLFYS